MLQVFQPMFVDSLKCFYALSVLSLGDLVDESVPLSLSEDAQESWAKKKMKETAVAFNVQHFMECDEKGGDELPIIEDLEEYVIAHKKLNAKSMTERLERIEVKEGNTLRSSGAERVCCCLLRLVTKDSKLQN